MSAEALRALLRRHGLALLALLVASGLALWPLPLLLVSPGDGLAIGHSQGDLADHYWGTWWFGDALLSGLAPLETDLIQFPRHVRLWYVDPLGALLALPLRVLGFPGTYNALVWLQVFAAAAAAYGVAVAWTKSRSAALVAGVVAGISPYAIGLVHSGLSEYFGLAPVVLYTFALVRALGLDPTGAAPSRKAELAAGAALALCTLQAFYYGAFGALLAGCAVLGPGWRDRLKPAVRVGAVYAVLIAPVLYVAYGSLTAENAAIDAANAPGWSFSALPATDVVTFFRWGDYYFPDTREDNPGILHVNHLGWAALLLAAAALWSRREGHPDVRRWGPMIAIFGLMLLGPRLCVEGNLPRWGRGSVPLPLAIFYIPGSPFRFVHHPYRLVAFAMPLLGMLAAAGALRLPRWARPVAAGAILAETLVLSPAPWPLATASVVPPDVYDDAPAGPVLDWPPDATTWNRQYALWQVTHHRPIAYGVNAFLPVVGRQDPLVYRMLAELRALERRAKNRDVAFVGKLRLFPAEDAPGLAGLGYRAIVLHREAMSTSEWTGTSELLRRELGAPALETEGESVWAILEVEGGE